MNQGRERKKTGERSPLFRPHSTSATTFARGLFLLIKRMETFFGRKINEADLLKTSQIELANKYLSIVMELRFTGVGKWENAPIHRILMSLIRKRPRDLVKLCTLAGRKTYERKSSLIQTVDFKSIFEEYSQGRIQDTINEYRSELPDIDKLLMNMRPTQKERTTQQSYVYKTDELLKKIQNISQNHVFKFANSRTIADHLDS
jgi:bisphosphoglycerate-dependent phosphoglycerate mutase